MATKITKANGLNGMHTAGIYADMTVDGPEIGTLVVIVDRAKNLPNRKSIGKQDPYCAARLGKEAQKTETDRRGGQTPKWDQELRFTVHDSPDYYQMKVSVFNDDKKTELIGETWVNLQEVIVPGGGQNDIWHNLNYKGKYAGEIRIEITYYDSRPKQEKPSEKMRQSVSNGVPDGARDAMTGPREPNPAPKRRPLPADPTSASPSPTATPPQFQTPPRGYQAPQPYVHTQSPLQPVEYSTPAQKHSQSQQGYRQSPGGMNAYATPPGMMAATPMGRPVQDEFYESQENYEANNSGHRNRYEDPLEDRRRSPNFRYDPYQAPSELPVPFEYGSLPNPDGPPPPPPAHRSNHASPAGVTETSNRQYEDPQFDTVRKVSFGSAQQDGFRHSMPAYSQPTSYQAYNPPHRQDEHASHPQDVYQETTPRHHSHDGRISGNYRSMQPTVEDDYSSPTNPYPSTYPDSESQSSKYDDRRYDQIPPTAPLNLSGRGSAASGQYNTSTNSSQQYYAAPSSSVSPVSYREPSNMGSEVSLQTSYSQVSQQSHRSQNQISQNDNYMSRSPGGYIPPLPPTLVAGMDPVIAQEVSERIYTENRASYNQNAAGSSRNRYSEHPNYRQSYSHPHRQEATAFVPAASSSSAMPFVPAAATYDDRQSRMSTNTYTPVIKPRAISPDTRVPTRKSVSPSPGASPEGRRLSGIPFGPDAYNALNPNVRTTTTAPAANSQSTSKMDGHSRPGQDDDFDSNAKIILHDGRAVDPSDHLPETSWAPEPESRGPKQPDSSRTRPTLAGAQPMPNSGSRLPRQTARPHSMGAAVSSPIRPTGGFSEPPAPVGRNRLQKKSNRGYGAPAAHSSPLAPISSYQDNSFTPKSLPRAQTLDFAGENGHGSYGNGKGGKQGGYARNSAGGPPPIPAKVPMNHGSAPLPPTENAWALLEEMKTIDLGGGRSRRRGDYSRAFA